VLIHPTTQAIINEVLPGNVHAIILDGPEGSGKFYLAKYIAYKKLGLMGFDELGNYPYIRIVGPEKQTIGIEQIRSVQKFLQLKTPGSASVRRVIIVRDAQLMTNEAQNALLKSLEEPPDDTLFVLTAPRSLRLKETIYSRVQQVPVLRVAEQTAVAYYHEQPADVKKAYLISDGLVGLMHALLYDESHPLLDQIAEVKKILSQPIFDRLTTVDVISKDKGNLPLLLQACKLICQSALHQSAKKSPEVATKWHQRLELVHICEASLDKNPSTKLLLTRLFIEL
jgi:hypothetical protein